VRIVAGGRELSDRASLIDAVANRYRGCGRYAVHFARGKLRHDPAYFRLLEFETFGTGARVLDLGCGQGILLALLATLRDPGAQRPAEPAAVAPQPGLLGMDIDERAVRWTQTALGPAGAARQADITVADYPRSDVIVLFDVLHYLAAAQQESVLARAAQALEPKGRLLIRVCDSRQGWRTRATLLADRVATWLRAQRFGAYHLRPIAEWTARLEAHGLQVTSCPMSQGTPFANVLLVARKA
jgi:cyclopropane fatty-acyl-phospholipid synthase-like methyltransferase